jgi:hypothetical protein
LQAGLASDLVAGMRLGQPPFDYSIESAVVSSRRETLAPGQKVLPESLPIPKGTVLLETESTAEYHNFDSLQVVGVTSRGRLVIGFASTSYQLILPEDVNPAQLYRAAVKTDLLADHCTHFTTLMDEAYVDLLPVRRHRCTEISLVSQHSASWGGLDLLDDWRNEPAHAALLAKVVEKSKARGMDI